MAEYISRNEAINAIKSLESSMPAKDNYAKGYDAALGRALIAVREAPPAADVQPIKRGRWSECYTDSHHYSGICTVCGKASIRSIKENPLEYCPKCGARMDGGNEDENSI